MQTIYAFSYNPAIATGTNSTGTNWRMAYQQPIMLYKGTANTIKIVVFNNNTHVVDLTNYSLKLQIVDKETQEHYVTRTANVSTPTSGVASVTFTENDLKNLNNRFYHIIAKLVDPDDGSSVVSGEILYLDDNYGAFTPVTIENAWNYNPTELSTEDGVQVINFRNIGETPDSYIGQAGKIIKVNSAETAVEFTNSLTSLTIGNLSIANTTIGTNLDTLYFNIGTQRFEFTDNSTDPTHQQGDGGFLTFHDDTHTNDGPRFEVWYGTLGQPADPSGQHSLDIRAQDNLSYVEFASYDLKSFMGIDYLGPFIQTNFDEYPDRYWRFKPDGELQLPFDGSKITSHGGQVQLNLNFSDFRISLDDGTNVNTTIFDTTGTVYFGGDLLPGGFDPDPTPIKSLGSTTHSWKDLYVANLTVSNESITPSTGNLTIAGNLLPSDDNTFDLGSPAKQWKHLYVANGSIYIDNIKLSNNNGKLEITKVVNPGEENEAPDPEDSDAGSEIKAINELVNGEHTFTLEDDGTLSLDGEPFTGGGGGAAGAVQPYLELTNDPFIFNKYDGPLVSFTKQDNGDEVDEIDTSLAITRGVNQGIFNPYLESDWDDTTSDGESPAGTLWNKDGWGDLTNLDQRIYLSFYETFLRYGNNVLAAEAIMKDVANNKYYKFDFTVWGNNGQGAPLTYTRTQINPTTGATIGSPVTFEKVGYADPTQVNDPIDTNLTIARGNQQSIYNIALETSYNTQGDGNDSPEGTEWNADGWGQLRDVKQRAYDTFYNAIGGQIGNNVVGTELIMHDTINDKYYAVKFSSWTQSGQGGGFSYTRRLINTDNYFLKPDNDTTTIDIFVGDDSSGAGIGITRDENNGIYNPYREGSWDEDVSPGGTLWNIDGWTDLTDITTRNYRPLYEAFGNGGLGNKIVGTECVMYIEDTDTYYAIKFLSWTQGGGGGFSYLRYEIDTTELNEGITFADGTKLKSAQGIGNVKLRAPGNRRIEEVAGYKQVSVTAVTTTNLTTTVSQNGTSTNTVWLDITTTTIDSIVGNLSTYGILTSTDIEFSVDNTTWYSWNGSTSFNGNQRGYSLNGNPQLTYLTGDTLYFRYRSGGAPVVWWNKDELPGGGANFRGAVIDYHAYTGDATWIGTIHIVDDDGEENITHTEVSSGGTDGENDDLWYVTDEGQIKYRRLDGESATLKVQWTAKVFYGSELYD